MSPREFEKISESIINIFPGEMTKTYYSKYSGGIHASGKLHDAYFNYRSKLAKSNLIKRRTKTKPIPANNTTTIVTNLDKSDSSILFI